MFALWCGGPLVALLIYADAHGTVFAGPGGGIVAYDQWRYLEWIRQAATHGLIAGSANASHIYLHPVFLISGVLRHLGLSLQLAYQVWLPAGIVVLFIGYRAFVWRMLPPGGGRTAGLVLALLGSSPLLPLLDWGGIVNPGQANQLVILSTQLSPFWQAWGYFPTAIALGLMPLYLLRFEHVLNRSRDATRRLVALTGLIGLTVSWLHPWGGLILTVITVVMGRRQLRRACVPLVALLAPLVYYAMLAGQSESFSLDQLRQSFTPGPWWTFVAVFGPIVIAAAIVRPRRRMNSDMTLVWLWVGSAVLVCLLLGDAARLSALEGISLPLAILAVLGWKQLGAGRPVSVTAVMLLTLPGAVYAAATVRDYVNDRYAPYELAPGELNALQHLPPGRVLATPYLAPALPALAGRFQGASISSTDDEALFDGRLGTALTTTVLRDARIEVLVSDCSPGRSNLDSDLGPLLVREQRFGCAAVYSLAR